MNELELFVALNEQAETVKAEGRKVAVILEGRDSAGKSGTIKNFTRYLPNYTFKVQPSFKPSRSVMRKWLSTWAKKMPSAGQIVFYDRSWYSRALCQALNGWASDRMVDNFLRNVEKRHPWIVRFLCSSAFSPLSVRRPSSPSIWSSGLLSLSRRRCNIPSPQRRNIPFAPF